MVDRNRGEFPGRQPQRLTYDELQQAVNRLSTILLEQGIRKDDIVAVHLQMSSNW